MQKKSILIIIGIIVVLLFILGAYYFVTDSTTNNDNNTQFQVGPNTFLLPQGYNITNTTNDTTKFSNGYNTISISYHDGNNVKKSVNNYINNKEKEGKEVILSNFTVKKTVVYKTELVNDSGVVHYWFKKGDNIYSLYTLDANKNTDKLVTDLIKTMNKTQ